MRMSPHYPNPRSPLMYLLLQYASALVDRGFSAYAVRGEVLSIEVKEIVTHFIVTCNDDASVTADKSMTCGEVLRAAVAFFRLDVYTKNH